MSPQGPLIEDIELGLIHTDWIFSPLISLLNPGLQTGGKVFLKELFFKNKLGNYTLGISMCIKGIWEVVRIDDRIPVWRR